MDGNSFKTPRDPISHFILISTNFHSIVSPPNPWISPPHLPPVHWWFDSAVLFWVNFWPSMSSIYWDVVTSISVVFLSPITITLCLDFSTGRGIQNLAHLDQGLIPLIWCHDPGYFYLSETNFFLIPWPLMIY